MLSRDRVAVRSKTSQDSDSRVHKTSETRSQDQKQEFIRSSRELASLRQVPSGSIIGKNITHAFLLLKSASSSLCLWAPSRARWDFELGTPCRCARLVGRRPVRSIHWTSCGWCRETEAAGRKVDHVINMRQHSWTHRHSLPSFLSKRFWNVLTEASRKIRNY